MADAVLPSLEPLKPAPAMVHALERAPSTARYTFGYFAPSLVFLSHDTVQPLADITALTHLLVSRAPFACVMQQDLWEQISPTLVTRPKVLSRVHGFDAQRRRWCTWVIIGNPSKGQG